MRCWSMANAGASQDQITALINAVSVLKLSLEHDRRLQGGMAVLGRGLTGVQSHQLTLASAAFRVVDAR